MVGEWWIGKDLKGNSCILIEVPSRNLLAEPRENKSTSQSG
jgi:hypothetical protein